ncbi:MAG TPA: hypothetical protein K8V47_06185, partial [Candidatus Amulumruptor caecigallinarius]|nr:hypothetical protein [Candidatus Amulumruptor caecigallinarius]
SLLVTLCCVLGCSAQFSAGFGAGDPDAWIDKEIYFVVQNQTYYQYANVMVFVGDRGYSCPGMWMPGGYLYVGPEIGAKISSGEKVKLFIGNQLCGSWTAPKSSFSLPSAKGKGLKYRDLKKVWKYLKRIR